MDKYVLSYYHPDKKPTPFVCRIVGEVCNRWILEDVARPGPKMRIIKGACSTKTFDNPWCR